MVIMHSLCHGILFTIVVWHDVLQWERMQAKGTDKEWGVKVVKRRKEDEHSNIGFAQIYWIPRWHELALSESTQCLAGDIVTRSDGY